MEPHKAETKVIELERRQGILCFAAYSCGADGRRTLLGWFPSFDLACQRFPDAKLNGIAPSDVPVPGAKRPY